MIEEHLKTFSEVLSQEEYADKHDWVQEQIEKLNELKQKMLKIVSPAEIKKSASILSQGVRTGSLFANLPDELLIKIAGHTGNPGIHTEKEAEKIAEKSFKPKK